MSGDLLPHSAVGIVVEKIVSRRKTHIPSLPHDLYREIASAVFHTCVLFVLQIWVLTRTLCPSAQGKTSPSLEQRAERLVMLSFTIEPNSPDAGCVNLPSPVLVRFLQVSLKIQNHNVSGVNFLRFLCARTACLDNQCQ